MPTGTKGGYDKARETYAKDNDKGNGGFFGNAGASIDKGIGGIKNAVGNFFTGGDGGGNSYGGGGRDSGAPSYSAFSAKGLTSSDPANVARNKAAAARYAAMPQRESENRGYMGRDKGIASLATPTPAPTPPPVTPPVVAPSLPVLNPTEGYTGATLDSLGNPVNNALGASPLGYGSAFAGLSQPAQSPYGGMNLMDIFAMYPELQYI